MNQEIAETFIRFFAQKYFSHLFPQEILDILQTVPDTSNESLEVKALLDKWDSKISIQSHWEGVLEDYRSDRELALLQLYKRGLFNDCQLHFQYEDNGQKECIFNPFGLVIRNENFFFVGCFDNNREPMLLSLEKIINIKLLDSKAIASESDFHLANYAETYLNHPVSPEIIETLIVEFPKKAYFYVKSHPIKCEQLTITEPQDTPGHFLLEAKNVANTIRLHQWFSGFHDDAQILSPVYLRRLINRSYIDQLTNLYNRKAFDRLGHREIEQSLRNQEHIFSLLIMDIDHFKTINDLHGHNFGDDVLIKVSECFRDYDAIRYGGEEFVVLLSNTGAENAQKAAERIRNNIAELLLKNETGQRVPITISIGIAEFPRHLPKKDQQALENLGKTKLTDKTKNGLMMAITEQADKALYYAKTAGRNQSAIFQDSIA